MKAHSHRQYNRLIYAQLATSCGVIRDCCCTLVIPREYYIFRTKSSLCAIPAYNLSLCYISYRTVQPFLRERVITPILTNFRIYNKSRNENNADLKSLLE